MKKICLINFDFKKKSNKFYNLKFNDGEGANHAQFGRIGSKGQVHEFNGNLSEFNLLLEKKIASGYRKAEIFEIEDHKPNKLDENIVLTETCLIECGDKDSQEFVNKIVQCDCHGIRTIRGNELNKAKLHTTPMGLIQRDTLKEALQILEEIHTLVPIYSQEKETHYLTVKQHKKNQIKNRNQSKTKMENSSHNLNEFKKKLIQLNTSYFNLIPTKLATFKVQDLIFSLEKVEEHKRNCSLMIQSLDYIECWDKVKTILIKQVNDEGIISNVSTLFESSKNSSFSGYVDLSTSARIKKIFQIQTNGVNCGLRHEQEKEDDIKQLWHGTKKENLLSIFANGLAPKKSSSYKAIDSTLSPGIYFSEAASKSLEFCDQLEFNSNSNSNSTIYLLLVSIAMGNYFIPEGECYYHPKLANYDSIWWKPGTSLVSQGIIVVNSQNRIRLDYIVEIEKMGSN